MFPLEEHLEHLPECSKVTFLLPREELESSEERNDMITNGVKVIHLVHPNAATFLEQSSAAEVSLEQSQDDFVFLRHVEGQRDLPAGGEIFARAKLQHKAAFAIDEPLNSSQSRRPGTNG